MKKIWIIIYILYYNIKLFFIYPKIFFRKAFFVLENTLWIHKDYVFHHKWTIFHIPNNVRVLAIIHETYDLKVYKNLLDCKYILDLWWFIWETALYFMLHWIKVDAYEPVPKNYDYLKMNLIDKEDCNYYNLAVVWDPTIEKLNFFESFDFDYSWWTYATAKATSYEVSTKFIWEIVASTTFDWLKMDIEWWERNIFEYFLLHDFPFKKWMIEFHYVLSNIDLFKKIISYLVSQGNFVELYDNYDKQISINTVLDSQMDLVTLFFLKI